MHVQASLEDSSDEHNEVGDTLRQEGNKDECPFHRLCATLVRKGDLLEIKIATRDLFEQARLQSACDLYHSRFQQYVWAWENGDSWPEALNLTAQGR